MKITDFILVIFAYAIAFLFGLLGGRFNIPEYYLVVVPVVIIVLSPFLDRIREWFYKRKEENIEYYVKSGWVPSKITFSMQQVIASVSVIGMIISLIYGLITSRTSGFNIISLYLYVAFTLVLIASLFMDTIIVSIKTSERKSSVEIEFPFLLALIRVLSETHLTLYDLLEVIKNSRALKAWASEIRRAESIAVATGSSLITAISFIAENHPSEIVRSIFRRIIIVGDLTGSIGDVAERVFDYVYEKFEEGLKELKSKFELISSLVTFLLILIPVTLDISPILSVITPMKASLMFILSGFMMFGISYVILNDVYPAGFKASAPALLAVIVLVSYVLVFILFGVEIYPLLIGKSEPQLSIIQYLMILTVLTALPAVASELWYVNIKTYTRLITAITDAIDVSVRSGEPFLSVLKRISDKYDQRVRRLIDTLVEGYNMEVYRASIVEKAPTIFHASFLETLMIALSVGAPPTALLSLSKSYESLINAWNRATSFSKTFELYMVMATLIDIGITRLLSNGLVGLFKTITSQQVSVPPILPILYINPAPVYNALLVTIPPVLALVSLVVGKTRAGNILYGGRGGLLVLVISSLVYMLTININLFK